MPSTYLIALLVIAGLGMFSPKLAEAQHVFAQVGEVSITTEDIEAELVRSRLESPSPEAVRVVAYSLLEHELLLRAARTRTLDLHPKVVRAARTQAVQHLMRSEFDAPLPRSTITEREITAHYAAHPERYGRGLEASSESIRGQLWRQRRDSAVAGFVEGLTERVGVTVTPQANLRMSRVSFPDVPATVVEQVQQEYECPHCARLNADGERGSTALGTPLPTLPAWTRRNGQP